MRCAMGQIFNGSYRFSDMTVCIDTEENFINIQAEDRRLDASLSGDDAVRFLRRLVENALYFHLPKEAAIHSYITNYFESDFQTKEQ